MAASHTQRQEAPVTPGDSRVPAPEPGLTQDAILTAEFEYIAQAVFQANEDRSRVTSLYLVTFGSLIAFIFSSTQQPGGLDPRVVYSAFALLFGALAVMSILTLLQVVRLRLAWFDGATALNRIKEYYVSQLETPRFREAFYWTQQDLKPRKFKVWSFGFLVAAQIAVLGGACTAAAVMFGGLAAQQSDWLWPEAAAAGLIVLAGEAIVYRYLLVYSKEGA